MKLIWKYINWNVETTIFEDWTKIRKTNDDEFIPEFPENFDCQISTYCSNGCDFCYAWCSTKWKDADLLKFMNLWNSLNPYTEIAININSRFPKNFEKFLDIMKERNIIVNITIHQKQFVKHFDYLLKLTEDKLIYWIWISLSNVVELLKLDIPKYFPNAVIHTILWITKPIEYLELWKDWKYKVLILWYKETWRWKKFKSNLDYIEEYTFKYKFDYVYKNIKELTNKFKVISFDNLAIEQLDLKRIFTEEEYEKFYMWDDWTFTLYVDLVSETFSKNSISKEKYKIWNKTIKEMFEHIRKQ